MDIAERRVDRNPQASDLITTYQRRGYKLVDSVDRDETNYKSVVLAKQL